MGKKKLHLKYNLIKLILLLILQIVFINLSFSEQIETKNSFLTANSIKFHEEISLISASGDVEVINGIQVLKADKLTYDVDKDYILAEGNVSLNDKKNNIFFSNKMELQGDLKKGVIKNFNSLLSDGSSLSANIILRDDENGDKLEKIRYTRCKLCEEDLSKPPIWQIRALKSNRNIDEGIIAYENVLLDVYGYPVLYIPYISHPDPSKKISSGLLSPKLKSNTIFGLSYSQPYYFALSKHKDLTLTTTMTSNEGPIIQADYRSLRSKGSSNIKTSFTRGSHNNIDGKESNKFRGHIDLKIAERINKNWTMGINATRASDFSYMQRYNMGNESDIHLTQRIYLSGSNKDFYTKIEGMYFQPLNAFKSNRNVPIILPNVKMLWHKNYDNGIVRKTSINSSIVAKPDASNAQKLSIKSSWSKNKISSAGYVLKTSLSARADMYRNKKTDNSKVIGKLGTHKTFRAIPKLESMLSFPVISYYKNNSILIEPIIQGIIANQGGNPDSIHNIDSIDFELSELNLFSSNRFTGLDRVEEGSRINLGIKSNINLNKFGNLRSIIGRSWNSLNAQDEYINGTGLDKKLSNIVGNIIYDYKNLLGLAYHFRRDGLNFRSQRDTLNVAVNTKSILAVIDYTMLRDDPIVTQNNLSEQANISLTWNINENWRSNIKQNRDLRNSNWGNAIDSSGYIEFINECIIIRLEASRKHHNLIDVPDATEYSLSFNLVGF
jgi:LPS-assembly protein